MKNFIYHRIFAYIVTIIIHIGNFLFIAYNLQRKIPIYPDLKIYQHFQPRYLTVWNVFFQITYAGISLFIDLMALKGKKDAVPKRLNNFRNVLFNALVLPYTVLVSSLFWSIYSYDRNLVFPTRADIFMTKTSNHILHTFIVLVVLWELVYQKRHRVTSHKQNCLYIFGMYCLYNIVLFYTHYGDLGMWPYNVLYVLEGTIFFPLFFVHIFITLYTTYFLQWRVKTGIWALRERITIKKA